MQYAVKELCRRISAPTKGDMKKLVRLGRYLVGRPRAVTLHPWQAARVVQDVLTDASWAWCKASRKSTSGGAMLVGLSCSEDVVQDPEHDCTEQR